MDRTLRSHGARGGSTAARGRLAGFVDSGAPQLGLRARPVRDFRGWLWQNGQCRDLADRMPECLRRTFYSIRLPVELFREALFHRGDTPGLASGRPGPHAGTGGNAGARRRRHAPCLTATPQAPGSQHR